MVNREALHHSVHSFERASERWEALREKGATDDEMRVAIGYEYGIAGGSANREYQFWVVGGANPRYWEGEYAGTSGKPTLKGQALIDAVRDLLEIPNTEGEEKWKQPKLI